MPEFINTIDILGDDVVAGRIIDRSITECNDNTVAHIRSGAFDGCSKLTTANFPVATSIGETTFRGCSKLTTVDFPEVKSVGAHAFNNCYALTTIKMPAVSSISGSSFSFCSALTTADFTSLTNIAVGAFNSCSKLTTLILRNITKVATLGNTGTFASTPIASGTGYIYVPRDLVDSYKVAANWSTFAAQFRTLEDYTVDGTVAGDFDGNRRMVRFFNEDGTLLGYKVVTVGSDAVWDGKDPTKEGDWVFMGWRPFPTNVTADMDCYPMFISSNSTYIKLVERTLSGEYENDRVTTIGEYAFNGTRIEKVNFAAATDIRQSAFQNTPITDASFPAISKISGSSVFDGTKLQNASFPLLKTAASYVFRNTQLTEITANNFPIFEEGYNSTFSNNSKLTYVNLPYHKGSNNNIFANSPVLRKAIVPNTRLDNGEFRNCPNLYYLDCSNGIKYNAVDFTSMTVLIIRRTSVASLNYVIPENCPLTNGTGYVYVPRSLIESYKVATNWSAVATQFRALEDYTIDGTITGVFDETKI